MEKLVTELRKMVSMKDTTIPGDIVLILIKELQMPLFAKVTDIERDQSRRDEWYHVHLTVLTVPMQQMTWTLREEQMTGKEIFTMGGEPRFMQAVNFSEQSRKIEQPVATGQGKKSNPGLKRVK